MSGRLCGTWYSQDISQGLASRNGAERCRLRGSMRRLLLGVAGKVGRLQVFQEEEAMMLDEPHHHLLLYATGSNVELSTM